MKWFKKSEYTPWEVLQTVNEDYKIYVIQVRMNINTGFKHFRCSKINPLGTVWSTNFNVDRINALTNVHIQTNQP